MKTGWEKVGMTDKEQAFYELILELADKLDRVIDILERQGAVRPG